MWPWWRDAYGGPLHPYNMMYVLARIEGKWGAFGTSIGLNGMGHATAAHGTQGIAWVAWFSWKMKLIFSMVWDFCFEEEFSKS